ncbi:acyl-CoA synthetase domain protein [Mycobacterium ulcerans str. Harvey]|uniref:Acyl-CoA synthetase domain protein n=1 Tax=Mycobacterium ulcerans str. Harvey TaxID=1299332 RepID=A0ABP3AIH8_MYCUL|nr:acyl-CoA synthetase domain protein [Mycobacterium ulcerans str. Harvey]
MQIAEANQLGVLLAQSRGPIDPTASVKRGVFAPPTPGYPPNTCSAATRTETSGWWAGAARWRAPRAG